jgi:hypothetical protein
MADSGFWEAFSFWIPQLCNEMADGNTQLSDTNKALTERLDLQ